MSDENGVVGVLHKNPVFLFRSPKGLFDLPPLGKKLGVRDRSGDLRPDVCGDLPIGVMVGLRPAGTKMEKAERLSQGNKRNGKEECSPASRFLFSDG